jgi:hypothetical protein
LHREHGIQGNPKRPCRHARNSTPAQLRQFSKNPVNGYGISSPADPPSRGSSSQRGCVCRPSRRGLFESILEGVGRHEPPSIEHPSHVEKIMARNRLAGFVGAKHKQRIGSAMAEHNCFGCGDLIKANGEKQFPQVAEFDPTAHEKSPSRTGRQPRRASRPIAGPPLHSEIGAWAAERLWLRLLGAALWAAH